MTTPRIQVAILGATGYGAGELLRLLVGHPHVRVAALVSSSRAGVAVAELHPHLEGFYDGLRTVDRLENAALDDGDDAVVFCALPHGHSGAAADAVLTDFAAAGKADRLRVIDLSGDLRLRDLGLHAQHYGNSPALPERRAQFVYGLPELQRAAVTSARCIANPGCLATAGVLALAPLMTPEFTGDVFIDAKTGSSGSGREPKETTHHPTRHADFRAYKPLDHQHEPEMLQAWGDAQGARIALRFVPQSLPVARGIFVTAHTTLPTATTTADLTTRYRAFYETSPFVRVRSGSPTLQDVIGSNFCDVGVAVRGRQVVAMAALDNLVKGMAGAAIQNMNLMCGLDERTGLWTPAFRPL